MSGQAEDLTGQVIGRWTVLGSGLINGRSGWVCQCTCGIKRTMRRDNLMRSKDVTVCGGSGRHGREMPEPEPAVDAPAVEKVTRRGTPRAQPIPLGTRFGKWVVLAHVPNEPGARRAAYWLCECDCGSTGTVAGNVLRSGKSLQCSDCRSAAFGAMHKQRG